MSSLPDFHPSRDLQPAWVTLDRNRILDLFSELKDHVDQKAFFEEHRDSTSQAEKLILMFLSRIRFSSKNTWDTYVRYICDFLNFLKKNPDQVVITDFDNYLNYLKRERNFSNSSLQIALASLRSFFKKLMQTGFLKFDPSQAVQAPPKKAKSELAAEILEVALDFDQVDQAKAYLEDVELRDRALFVILTQCALRVSELAALTYGHFVVRHGRWFLDIQGKGRKRRYVALPDESRSLLFDLRKEVWGVEPGTPSPEGIQNFPIFFSSRGATSALCRSAIWRIVSRIGHKALGRKLWPHALRHTSITQLNRLGVGLNDLASLAGHENLETTRIYIAAGDLLVSGNLVFDKARVDRAVDRGNPKEIKV